MYYNAATHPLVLQHRTTDAKPKNTTQTNKTIPYLERLMSALLQHWVTVVCSPNELVFKLVEVPAQEASLRSQSILDASYRYCLWTAALPSVTNARSVTAVTVVPRP